MDSVPSLKRKSTSVRSSDTVDLTISKRRSINSSLPRSASKTVMRTSSSVASVKKVLSVSKPKPLRKNPTRERRKPKPMSFENGPSVVGVKKPAQEKTHRISKLLYRRLAYLSVRNDEDAYFICQALQNVYATMKEFRVQWLSFEPKTDSYFMVYLADISPESVLMPVHMKAIGGRRYKLREVDRIETERLLKKSINKAKGQDVSDEESEDEEEEEEPPAKKKKVEKKTKKVQKGKKEKKPRVKKEKKEKVPRWALLLFDSDGCTVLCRTANLQLENGETFRKGQLLIFKHCGVIDLAEILAVADWKKDLNEFECDWQETARSEAIQIAKDKMQQNYYVKILREGV